MMNMFDTEMTARRVRGTVFAVIPALVFALLAVLIQAPPAQAQLRVDITRGTVQPLPIAIPEFFGKTPQETEIGRDMANLISADLERSGLFKPIDRLAFIQKVSALRVQPRFGDWRQINAQALVAGSAEAQRDGRLKVEFRLWDVFGEAQLTGLAYFTAPDNWRRVAHIIADEIYKRITGESGYFDTRVVYISETGPSNRRIKRLAIMDQDGANHRFLTDGRALVLTPRFSPTAQEITYLSYTAGRPRVYLYNIDTGQQEIIGDFPGMTFAPRFSPDGNKVIMSMAQDGNSERLQFRPRRLAADLRDGSGRRRGETHQFRHRPLRDAGLVAARRPDRLHSYQQGRFFHRDHAPRRFGRTAPGERISRRRADLGAQRAGSDVFPRTTRQRAERQFGQAVLDRSDRPQRTRDRNAGRRVGPGLVAAGEMIVSSATSFTAPRDGRIFNLKSQEVAPHTFDKSCDFGLPQLSFAAAMLRHFNFLPNIDWGKI